MKTASNISISLHEKSNCGLQTAVWMFIIRPFDLWISVKQILVVYNKWLTWWIWSGPTRAKSRRQAGGKESAPRGLKEQWHLSTQEIEWDVSEQQRLDRPRVLSKHKAANVMLSSLEWDRTYRTQWSEETHTYTHMHTQKATDHCRHSTVAFKSEVVRCVARYLLSENTAR